MYKIVLIDDDQREYAKIRRTIKENAPEKFSFTNRDYDFEEFNLEQYNRQEEIKEKLISLIKSKEVSTVLIDYKLLTNNKFFAGNQIFADIYKAVSKFPIIILTERMAESMEGFLVDADKVYEKSEFLKLESQYAKEKVSNMFYNMECYVKNLNDLEYKLDSLIVAMKNNMTEEIINEIYAVETELSKYIPLDHCQADEMYNADNLKEIVSLINQANKLIKG